MIEVLLKAVEGVEEVHYSMESATLKQRKKEKLDKPKQIIAERILRICMIGAF